MAPKLQINLFTCSQKAHRLPFMIRMIEEIKQAKHKANFILYVYAEAASINSLNTYFTNNKPGFKVGLIQLNTPSYQEKINIAHKSECEYSCKLDDDVLMSRHVWDFAYENLNKITKLNPIIAPIFTNGIPSADYFVEDFLTGNDINQAHTFFLTDPIADTQWGLDYTGINQKIQSMSIWNAKEYWNAVNLIDTKWETNNVPWYYFMVRGVHPARYSKKYNIFIANKIIENKNKFFDKQVYKLEANYAPYFCNNLFICKTQFWRDTYKLFNDGWDEGQLTLQMRLDNSSPLYIRNGYAIHMAYGMTRGQQEIESYYIQNFGQKI